MENKNALLAIANGSEDLEIVTIYNMIKRAGIHVTMAKVNENGKEDNGENKVECARGINITTETNLNQCLNNEYDLIVLPGGVKGSQNLSSNPDLINLLKKQKKDNKYYAAICAAPYFVFELNGLLENESATCYPSFHGKLQNQSNVKERVVVSNNCSKNNILNNFYIFSH